MENSKSENEESKIQNSDSRINSSSEKKKSGIPDHIRDIWASHDVKLTRIHYMNPTDQNSILPQFFANNIYNVHLAAVFSIPVMKMHDMDYEQRLHLWAENLIHHFGNSIDIPRYESWYANVYVLTMDISQVSTWSTIQGRLFFNDVHEMCSRWGRLGTKFLNDLFFWVWEKLKNNEAREWDLQEEETYSAPYQGAYVHDDNYANKEEDLRKGEAELRVPQTTPLNILFSNYAIKIASKKKRGEITPKIRSYVRDKRWPTVWPDTFRDIYEDWAEIKVKDLSPPTTPKGPPIPTLSERNTISWIRTWIG